MSDTQPAQPATPALRPTEVISPEAFITSAPLYVVTTVNGFTAPNRISFECPKDFKETTWEHLAESKNPLEPEFSTNLPGGLIAISYRCLLCRQSILTLIYTVTSQEKRERPPKRFVATGLNSRIPTAPKTEYDLVTTGVMKIGQYPKPSVHIAKGLEKSLGEEATDLYRKALISRNNGHGLAAVSYMRRVVEDKTNELIESAAELAESFNVEPNIVAQMREAADSSKYTTYEAKLQYAGTVFPVGLKVDGVNPLGVLYQLVSEGLHDLDEENCVHVADEIKEVFEYLFLNLKAQVANQKAFAERLKKLHRPRRIEPQTDHNQEAAPNR